MYCEEKHDISELRGNKKLY